MISIAAIACLELYAPCEMPSREILNYTANISIQQIYGMPNGFNGFIDTVGQRIYQKQEESVSYATDTVC